PDSLGRYALVRSFIASPSKATDAPFCGDNILASQPTPRAPILGTDYYDYPPQFTGDKFKSFYERLVGGSTWHWQGIHVRMVPNDFENSVTEKALNLNERGVLSAAQGSSACNSYNTDKPTSPGEPNCNPNRQKWFVLLQAGIL